MPAAPIKVYPAKASAIVMSTFHKDRPALTEAGALWPNDGFTMRRLNDRSITKDEAKAYKAPAAEAVEPPAA